MKMKAEANIHSKITVLFCLLLFAQFSFADALGRIDSLKSTLTHDESIDNVRRLNFISEYYWGISIDSSLVYAEKALNLAEKIGFLEGKASAYLHFGGSYFYLSNYYSALKNFKLSLALWQKVGDKKNESAVLSNISMIYISLGLFEKALDYNKKSQVVSEEINDIGGIATAHYINSSVFDNLNIPDKALDEAFTALELFKKQNNLRYVQSLMNNIGSIYEKQGQDSLALRYYKKAIYLADQLDNKHSYAHGIGNIGSVFYKLNELDSAFFYCFKSLAMFERSQLTSGLAKILHQLAYIHFEMQNFDSAFYYLEKGYGMAYETQDRDLMLSYNDLYSEYYIKQNDFENAYTYHKEYSAIKDSIFAEKTKNKITDYQVEIETAQIQSEKEIQELKAKKSTSQRNLSILISLLVIILAIVIFSRYTLKKRTNKLLEQKNKELENANNTKDKFFAIVSHDLKNQLTAFQNISSVLAENFKSIAEEKKHHLILRINTAANTLYGVLENLLTWSSSQLKGIEYKPSQIQVKSVCQKTIEELRLNAERKKIQLNCFINDSVDAFADENMLKTVIRNLCNNAIKFSPENSQIDVKADEEEAFVKISVIDQGVGLSKSDLEKLFRIDINHKDIGKGKEKGAGLGLVISKEFVDKMGGQIWVESELNIGSTFSFTIPNKKA
jgi:signal transduction histidine kinase/tetratricopeptide (TPR) repeat protein